VGSTALEVLEKSPCVFIRIHKSYIVAIESITAVRKTSVFIKDMELPIGETFRDAVDNLVRKGL